MNSRLRRRGRRVEEAGSLERVTLDGDPKQSAGLRSHETGLAECGFALEPFGERTYLVRAVPALLSEKDWTGMLKESLDTLSGENWAESIAISMACHSAVRAGQALTGEEMRELIQQLGETTLPHTCPHGRPTMIHLSSGQLKKEFGRT